MDIKFIQDIHVLLLWILNFVTNNADSYNLLPLLAILATVDHNAKYGNSLLDRVSNKHQLLLAKFINAYSSQPMDSP